jgi:high-affinity nickel-transport protein
VEAASDLATSGAWLMFLLGLRHGFDPDHIAIVDALAVRAHRDRPALSPWVGSLFALGHGGVVCAVAVAVCLLSRSVSLPGPLATILAWLPVIMLVALGTASAVSLWVTRGASPSLWGRLARVGAGRPVNPVSVIVVGALFALVFDTTSQAAAWGYAASRSDGVEAAIVIGAVFTLGMMITDTLDSHLLSGLMRRASHRDARAFRVYLSLLVVALSYGIAALGTAERFGVARPLSDSGFTAIGVGCVVLVAAGYVWLATRPGESAPPCKTGRRGSGFMESGTPRR